MQAAFNLGQLVRPKPSLPGQVDSRAYCIIRILPARNGAPVYLIKNMIGAERIIGQNEIEPVSDRTLP